MKSGNHNQWTNTKTIRGKIWTERTKTHSSISLSEISFHAQKQDVFSFLTEQGWGVERSVTLGRN